MIYTMKCERVIYYIQDMFLMTYDIGYILDNIPHTISIFFFLYIRYNISYIIYDILFLIYNFKYMI